MNNEISVIHSQVVLNKQLEVYGTKEEPLFLAKDVAEWIEHSNVSSLVKNMDEDEKLLETMFIAGQNRDVLFLTEDGLYEVLLQSRKEIAKQFKKEVKFILKNIRKHGVYATSDFIEQALTDPDFAIQAFTNLKQERLAREKAEALLVEQKPKVDFANHIETSEDTLEIGEYGKIIGLGRNKLFEFLRANEILINKGVQRNLPYQKYIDQNYFEVEEIPYVNRYNLKSELQLKTKVTGKGQTWLLKKLKEKNVF